MPEEMLRLDSGYSPCPDQLRRRISGPTGGDKRSGASHLLSFRACDLWVGFRCYVLLVFTVPPLNARVVRVEIASRQEVSDGKAFGNAGAYERITGRVFFSVPVANPHNRGIVDLDKAVNLNHGSSRVFRRLHGPATEGFQQEQRFPAA